MTVNNIKDAEKWFSTVNLGFLTCINKFGARQDCGTIFEARDFYARSGDTVTYEPEREEEEESSFGTDLLTAAAGAAISSAFDSSPSTDSTPDTSSSFDSGGGDFGGGGGGSDW